MPVSIQELRERQATKLAKAQAAHDKVISLLDCLHPDTPVPQEVHAFGYCAEYTLEFRGEGLTDRLLALYPPAPLVNVRGMDQSQKPRSYLRDEEARAAILDIHPVLTKYRQAGREATTLTCWWTELPCGSVQLTVTGELGTFIPDMLRFEPCTHAYSTGRTTFYTPKLAPVDGQLMPRAAWEARWEQFAKDSHYTGAQKAFLHIIRERVNAGLSTTAADLPDVQSKEAVHKNRQWGIPGDYWSYFDQASSDALLQFVVNQATALPVAKFAQLNAEQDVVNAFQKLLAGVSTLTLEHSGLGARIEQWVRRKSGWAVTLAGLHQQGSRLGAPFRVWVRYASRTPGLEFTVPAAENGRRLQPQDIEVIYL